MAGFKGKYSDEDVLEQLRYHYKKNSEIARSSFEKDETVKNSIDRQIRLIRDFNRRLCELGFSTRVFNPAGQDDIGGGCGQLWYFQDWLKHEGINKS